MRKTTMFRASGLVGVMVLAGVFSASAQSISKSGPGRISVEAEKVPLATLIKELGNIATLEMVLLSPEAEKQPVSLTIKDVPIKEAIQEILEAAGVNHTVWGGNGEAFRIYAGLAEDAVSSPRGPNETEASESPRGATIPPAPTDERSTAASEPDREQPSPSLYPFGGSIQSPTAPSSTEPPSPGEPPSPDEPPSPGDLQPPEESRPPDEYQPPEELQPPEEPRPQRIPPEPPEPPSWFRNVTGSARLATGGAFLATDSSLLHNRPGKTQLALTMAILALGLTMGVALVRNPDKTPPRRGTDRQP